MSVEACTSLAIVEQSKIVQKGIWRVLVPKWTLQLPILRIRFSLIIFCFVFVIRETELRPFCPYYRKSNDEQNPGKLGRNHTIEASFLGFRTWRYRFIKWQCHEIFGNFYEFKSLGLLINRLKWLSWKIRFVEIFEF